MVPPPELQHREAALQVERKLYSVWIPLKGSIINIMIESWTRANINTIHSFSSKVYNVSRKKYKSLAWRIRPLRQLHLCISTQGLKSSQCRSLVQFRWRLEPCFSHHPQGCMFHSTCTCRRKSEPMTPAENGFHNACLGIEKSVRAQPEMPHSMSVAKCEIVINTGNTMQKTHQSHKRFLAHSWL